MDMMLWLRADRGPHVGHKRCARATASARSRGPVGSCHGLWLARVPRALRARAARNAAEPA